MCKAEDDWLAEQSHDQSVEAAIKLIQIGKLTLEEISDFLKLPLDEVKELTTQNTPVISQ